MQTTKIDMNSKSIFDSFPSVAKNISTTQDSKTQQQVQMQDKPMVTLQQQSEDIFEGKKTSVIDNVVKYSGLASLIAIPVVAVLLGKKIGNINSNGINNTVSSLQEGMSTLTQNVNALTQKVNGLVVKIAENSTALKTVETATGKLGKKVGYFLAIVAAGGIGAATVKAFDTKDMNSEEKAGIERLADKVLKLKNTVIQTILPSNSAVVSENEPIWGNLYVKGLNAEKTLSPDTIKSIKSEITRAVSGQANIIPTSKKDTKLWSVSYETQFNNAGGQKDIAEQAPVAYSKAGVDTYAVAPLFDAVYRAIGDKSERTLTKQDNGKYIYKTQCYKKGTPVELDKIHEGKTSNGEKFSVYEGVVDGQKTLFVSDDKYFNYKDTELKGGSDGTVYANLPHSNERLRMAQFNNIVYETIAAAKEGKIKHADGTLLEAPNKMVSHEAWQSGGLLAKLRLVSIAEEADKVRSEETSEYLRSLADNTAIPIHNIGKGYQAILGNDNSHVIRDYFNVLYGKYSAGIVNNAFIEGVKDTNDNDLYGSIYQRIGFIANCFNASSMAVLLAGKIGTVSEGYCEEICDKNLAGPELSNVLKLKRANGGLVAFPNGVDKADLAASTENIKKTMTNIENKLKELLGESADTKIRPYVNKYTDDKSVIDAGKFAQDKLHNKKLFISLLKDAAKGKESPLFGNGKAKADFIANPDISDINENTTIFSLASRLDEQKGFDTAIIAYKKVLEAIRNKEDKAKYHPEIEVPVMIISGGAKGAPLDGLLEKYINDIKNKYPEARILWTRNRMSEGGLLLMNMTTTTTMPSDFEPYGISDLKGLYAGSHVIVTEVGGMLPSGKISRKIYPAQIATNIYGSYTGEIKNLNEANALSLSNYKYRCVDGGNNAENFDSNTEKLSKLLLAEMSLTPEDRTKLDLNAISLDVSWDKGATQNYFDILKIQ